MTKTNGTRVLVMMMAAALAAALLVVVAAADPAEARARFKTVTTHFSNAGGAINIDTVPTAASPYPSGINVSGLRRGKIRDVNVKLKNLTEPIPDNVDVLLVGPRGQNAVVMSDAGGNNAASGVTLTLDDQATLALPNTGPLVDQTTYKPRNYELPADIFPPPAPPTSGASALSVFNGTNPNGTWKLYVVDDNGTANPVVGKFASGWTLEIKARVKR